MDVCFNYQNVYQPDIIFIAAERLSQIRENEKIKGSPDLIIEVLSPSTENLYKTENRAE